MKKTLVALALAGVATSASAVTVYDNDGSKIDFYGSLRMIIDNVKKDGEKEHAHTNLHNAGSRFGVKVQHQLNDDVAVLGRVEMQFKKNSGSTDQFGDLYARIAKVGFESKKFGTVTFGNQKLLGDEIKFTDFGYTYAAIPDDLLVEEANSSIRYDYTGIEGLTLSADYRFATKRGSDGEVLENERKGGYTVGALYEQELANNQAYKVALGYSRDTYKTTTEYKDYRDSFALAGEYDINDFAFAVNLGRVTEKENNIKTRTESATVGVKYQVIPASAVYAEYGYERVKEDGEKSSRKHSYVLGADYKLHKQVLVYVEGAYSRDKDYGATDATRDKAVGVGMRVYW